MNGDFGLLDFQNSLFLLIFQEISIFRNEKMIVT